MYQVLSRGSQRAILVHRTLIPAGSSGPLCQGQPHLHSEFQNSLELVVKSVSKNLKGGVG